MPLLRWTWKPRPLSPFTSITRLFKRDRLAFTFRLEPTRRRTNQACQLRQRHRQLCYRQRRLRMSDLIRVGVILPTSPPWLAAARIPLSRARLSLSRLRSRCLATAIPACHPHQHTDSLARAPTGGSGAVGDGSGRFPRRPIVSHWVTGQSYAATVPEIT